ncbi:MAG TPA: RagB/SusD family nutrient uptake outer membrane protein [Longimicrobiaceae bacterium]|nr:RagB/SusD family nutrient uptake outer membrane protein [Longimicrobiaceae bacterium]
MIDVKRYKIALAFLLIPLGGCDNLFTVEAPGRIANDNLNEIAAFPALVAGMSADLTDAYDATANYTLPVTSGELFHSGSYAITDVAKGILLPEDMNGEWGQMQQARWVAESGIERMQGILSDEQFNSSSLVARAYLYAGLANRLLGENVCSTTIDGGPEQPNTVHFERAIEQFTNAIEIGQRAADPITVTAAYGGRASVRAWMGDWAGAVQDAQQVPVDFSFNILFNSGAGNGNDLYIETHDRYEFSVYNTIFEDHPDDPRAPWDTVFTGEGEVDTGANGLTPVYQQQKYLSEDADNPAVKGTGMLVLRAENALRNGDIGLAYSFMNDARAFYGMDPLVPASTIEEAWDDLHYERGATLWLEGRRLWDLRRWFNAGPSSPAYHPFLEDRDKCLPISEEERESNPNLQA